MKDIHNIRPPVQTGFDPAVFAVILVILGGILFLILLFFLIKKILNKRKQSNGMKYLPEPVPPYDAALRELELLSQKQTNDPRQFYFYLTAVLKKYIGRCFHSNALEMTSQEFIKYVKRLDFKPDIKKDISEFVNLSDPFKYAGVVPEYAQVKQDLLFVKQTIQQIQIHLTHQAEKEEKRNKEEIK